MELDDFDYRLPEELIARRPLPERDRSRLLHLPLAGGPPDHRTFRDLPQLLRPGDLLVANDARVVRARLRGVKAGSGGQVEVLLERPLDEDPRRWLCLAQASKGFRVGQRLELAGGALQAEVVAVHEDGFIALEFSSPNVLELAEAHGFLPLPAYLGREADAEDAARYQTIFARQPGAVAAPTAGLHFSPEVLDALERRGVIFRTLTLLVGPGTFLPVRGALSEHRMHREQYAIPGGLATAVAETKRSGGRVVAVGTTSARALEAAADGGALREGSGETDLFIQPGYRFQIVDGLLTNFHLPRSTLLMLVSALAGRERVLDAYAQAVAERYRFFSYGDCCLFL
jgi:S-adenosylmethionine:tRNA ribosyltransferase-isomerase